MLGKLSAGRILKHRPDSAELGRGFTSHRDRKLKGEQNDGKKATPC